MKAALLLAALLFSVSFASAKAGQLRILVLGAHPDDCDMYAGGTAALFIQMGHQVKFVSLTNGDKGHHRMSSDALAVRRKKEMQEVAKRLGVVYENLDNHDGELMPTLENRLAVIRLIRDWKADIVISHRPNDYHPDHRYASVIVQDAAYMISVPLMAPGSEPMLNSPLFLYMEDGFKKPNPFSPDIVVDITPVLSKKLEAIDAHASQVYEWLPWNGGYENELPITDANRTAYLTRHFCWTNMVEEMMQPASRWYAPKELEQIKYYEAFEICEYGSSPNKEEIKALFPMLPL